jgi:pimeloyl-ACP methyl ester carboxylesterase
VRNNPLTLTDPSGFSWLSKAWHRTKHALLGQTQSTEIVRAILKNEDFVSSHVGFVHAVDNYTASHPWVQMIGTAVATRYGGAVGAAYAAAHNANISGAGVDDAMKAGVIAGASAFAFSAIGGYYGDSWSIGRVGWTAVAGGATSAASGGSFQDGFLMSGGMAAVAWGYSEMKVTTDSYKATACAQGLSSCDKIDGEWLTDGGRGPAPGSDTGRGNFITRGGMALEGSAEHVYNEYSLIGRYVNAISKAHDWFNSDLSKVFGFKGYDASTGMWLAGGDAYNTAFQIYSFSGMLPAAAFTSVSLLQPYSSAIIQARSSDY